MAYENKREPLEYGPTVGRDGLKVFGRVWSDERMRQFDRYLDSTDLSDEKKRSAKRTLRKMQGLPYDEAVAGVDAAVIEALRRLAAEMGR